MCTGSHPYIEVPETAEVRLKYLTPGGVAENVINFQKDGGWAPGEMEDLANAVKDSWETNISTDVTEDVSLDEVVATDISTETGPQFALPAGISGAIASPALPQNVTLAIAFRTGLRGRSYRGRLYYVGLAESQVVGDQVSEAFQGGIIENFEAFFEGVSDAVPGATHVVVSRCQDDAWLTTAVVTPVLTYTADRTIDTQKRRLLGHGI